METTSDSNVHEREIVDRHEVITNVDRPPLLSWGAILGGLVFVVSISWLLNMLGIALGVSIADATDGEAIGAGLTTGAIVWMVLSWLIAFFVGALLTARLSGKVDDTAGMLHGMVLWGVATTMLIVLGSMGFSSLLRTGYSVVENTAATALSAIPATASALESASSAAADMSDTRLGDNIKARLKRRASRVVSQLDSGDAVSAQEIRTAIDSLDSNTLQEIATHVVMGEMTQAREEFTAATRLSDREVRQLLTGIEDEFEEQLGMDDNDTGLVADISSSLKGQLADFVANLDNEGGASVTTSDVREALNQLDRQTMQTVSMRLINGDIRGAKDALAANTSLSTRQINDVVDGVYDDVARTIDKYQAKADAAMESATSYAQAVLWTIFVAAAMGLGVSLLGGWLGAESSRRLELEVRRDLART